MKKLVLVGCLLSASAYAHVEPGVYNGRTGDGKSCSMSAGVTYFENNTPHPLNERIPIKVGDGSFKVGHPAVIDAGKGTVGFNHDVFHGLFPTKSGAVAIEIEMEHSKGFEGPKSFTVMESFWREKRSESYKCQKLVLEK